MERQVEEDENCRNHHGDDEHEPPGGPLLVLELAAIFDEVSGRERHVLLELRPHLVHETSEIAPADVGHDDDAALALFAFDDFASPRHLDGCDLIKRHLFAGGRLQLNCPHRVGIGSIL